MLYQYISTTIFKCKNLFSIWKPLTSAERIDLLILCDKDPATLSHTVEHLKGIVTHRINLVSEAVAMDINSDQDIYQINARNTSISLLGDNESFKTNFKHSFKILMYLSQQKIKVLETTMQRMKIQY